LARIIQERTGVAYNLRYLSDWLKRRRVTPQKPQRVAREQDADEIARWLAGPWPRIKKTPAG
jgi:transposase